MKSYDFGGMKLTVQRRVEVRIALCALLPSGSWRQTRRVLIEITFRLSSFYCHGSLL